ncbi:hypothetical protein SAMN05443247_03781 [Bradyrhizobium erythrophlei]|nr:hypothetical protein SAMN05443247_03781 [Bradyrhizobium erythrophlei]
MNKHSENKTTSLQDEPNKAKPTKDELNEQDLNKVAGGLGPVDGLRFGPVDGLRINTPHNN